MPIILLMYSSTGRVRGWGYTAVGLSTIEKHTAAYQNKDFTTRRSKGTVFTWHWVQHRRRLRRNAEGRREKDYPYLKHCILDVAEGRKKGSARKKKTICQSFYILLGALG